MNRLATEKRAQIVGCGLVRGAASPRLGEVPQDKGGGLHAVEELAVSLERVKANFERYGLLDEQVRFPGGLVPRHPA